MTGKEAWQKVEDGYDWIMETEGRKIGFAAICGFFIGLMVGKL